MAVVQDLRIFREDNKSIETTCLGPLPKRSMVPLEVVADLDGKNTKAQGRECLLGVVGAAGRSCVDVVISYHSRGAAKKDFVQRVPIHGSIAFFYGDCGKIFLVFCDFAYYYMPRSCIGARRMGPCRSPREMLGRRYNAG